MYINTLFPVCGIGNEIVKSVKVTNFVVILYVNMYVKRKNLLYETKENHLLSKNNS